MSNVEADPEDHEGLRNEEYLDALVAQAPSVNPVISNVRINVLLLTSRFLNRNNPAFLAISKGVK